MRTFSDRLRHTVMFEILLIIICVPLLTFLLKESPQQIGALSIMMSLIAMAYNYFYNLAFDLTLKRLGRPLYPRGAKLRAAHAFIFEIGFLGVSVPMVMWWMNFGFWQALGLDLAFMIAVPIYAFVFNWVYDTVFPVTETAGVSAD